MSAIKVCYQANPEVQNVPVSRLNSQKPPPAPSASFSRRYFGLGSLAATSVLLPTPSSKASKLPEAADKAWEAMGGGPADLTYPDNFLGIWNVESILVSIDLPQGQEFVPDMAVVKRAEEQDKGRIVRYRASFIRNPRGQVVTDRRFNTASLMHTYLGIEQELMEKRIQWNISDPNRLDMSLPGGMNVTTRVMKRLEEQDPSVSDRLATSEFFQQLIETETQRAPRIKASQAYTKYHWRSSEKAGDGPEIVATQVVSEYLNPIQTKPVSIYTYKMAFTRLKE